MSGKLKSPSIIILGKGEDIDRIIESLKSSGEQVGGRYIRIIMRADLWSQTDFEYDKQVS